MFFLIISYFLAYICSKEAINKESIKRNKGKKGIKMETTGFKIKLARIEKKMTQQQLAQELNISQAAISQVEKGQRCPSEQIFCSILKLLDMPLGLTPNDEKIYLLKNIDGLRPESIHKVNDYVKLLLLAQNEGGRR